MAQQGGSILVAPENRPGNVKFDKIWNRAKDCDVASVVLHNNGGTLCMDDKHALTADEVRDCCEHGCIIQSGIDFYRPVNWKETDGVLTVVCLNNTGSSGSLVARVFTSYQAS